MSENNICIYIHIPFCIRKCSYCDFPSFKVDNKVDNFDPDSYFRALEEEIDGESELRGRTVDTVYIGGGTPSCVPPDFIIRILKKLRKTFVFDASAEISMEMNPGTVNAESLRSYREAGVNRVSLGCQSFNDESLRRLGRIHSRADILRSFDLLRKAGFDNINLDLISSLPWENSHDIENSLSGCLSLGPEHISVYSLIIEPGTEFFKIYGNNENLLPDEDSELQIDLYVRTRLHDAGYARYEISNYSKEGYECRHNLACWNRREYRGYGLSAASLIGKRRFTNTRDKVYITNPGKILEEDRILSEKEEMSEFMFLGLRQIKGVSSDDFRKSFNTEISDIFSEQLERQINNGFMEYRGGRYYYNEKGLNVSNILMSEFI